MKKETTDAAIRTRGKPYIDINGKVFFLIRGFGTDRDKPSTSFVFVQVTGRYALSKTDLPNDNWRVIARRGMTRWSTQPTTSAGSCLRAKRRGESACALKAIANNYRLTVESYQYS